MTQLQAGDRVQVEYEPTDGTRVADDSADENDSPARRRRIVGSVTRTCGGTVVVVADDDRYRVDSDHLSVVGGPSRVGRTVSVTRVVGDGTTVREARTDAPDDDRTGHGGRSDCGGSADRPSGTPDPTTGGDGCHGRPAPNWD